MEMPRPSTRTIGVKIRKYRKSRVRPRRHRTRQRPPSGCSQKKSWTGSDGGDYGLCARAEVMREW